MQCWWKHLKLRTHHRVGTVYKMGVLGFDVRLPTFVLVLYSLAAFVNLVVFIRFMISMSDHNKTLSKHDMSRSYIILSRTASITLFLSVLICSIGIFQFSQIVFYDEYSLTVIMMIWCSIYTAHGALLTFELSRLYSTFENGMKNQKLNKSTLIILSLLIFITISLEFSTMFKIVWSNNFLCYTLCCIVLVLLAIIPCTITFLFCKKLLAVALLATRGSFGNNMNNMNNMNNNNGSNNTSISNKRKSRKSNFEMLSGNQQRLLNTITKQTVLTIFETLSMIFVLIFQAYFFYDMHTYEAQTRLEILWSISFSVPCLCILLSFRFAKHHYQTVCCCMHSCCIDIVSKYTTRQLNQMYSVNNSSADQPGDYVPMTSV